jgi:hypothetical protein
MVCTVASISSLFELELANPRRDRRDVYRLPMRATAKRNDRLRAGLTDQAQVLCLGSGFFAGICAHHQGLGLW